MKRILLALAVVCMAASQQAFAQMQCDTSLCITQCARSSNVQSVRDTCFASCRKQQGQCLKDYFSAELENASQKAEADRQQRRAEREAQEAQRQAEEAALERQREFQRQQAANVLPEPQYAAPSPPAVASRSHPMLGDLRNLAQVSERWIAGEDIRELEFILTGVGLTLADRDAMDGAGIVVRGAMNRLQPELIEHFRKLTFGTIRPPQLRVALQRVSEPGPGFDRVPENQLGDVFASVSDRDAESVLMEQLRLVARCSKVDDLSEEMHPLWKAKTEADLRMIAKLPIAPPKPSRLSGLIASAPPVVDN